MPTMINGTTLYDTITVDKQNGTKVKLDTDKKYIEKDIELTINVQGGSATTPNTSITANPTLSINSETGVITGTVSETQSVTPNVSSGFISSGTAGTVAVSGSNTLRLTTMAGGNFIPWPINQTISAGVWLNGDIVIVGDANLTGSNIKSGTSIYNYNGTFTDESTVSNGQTAATAAQILSGYSAWVNGVEVQGTIQVATTAETMQYLSVSEIPSATYAFLIVTYPAGAICTASNGTTTLTAPDTSGTVVFAIPSQGIWTITAQKTGQSISHHVSVSNYGDRYTDELILLPDAYQMVEYIAVGDTNGPYISIGLNANDFNAFEIYQQYTGTPNPDTYFFGRWESYRDTNIGYYNNQIRFAVGNAVGNAIFDTTNIHKYSLNENGGYVDDVKVLTPNFSNMAKGAAGLFSDMTHAATKYCRIYSCKLWNDNTLLRDFVPCYRKSDDVPGMYDIANDVFYTNAGTGNFSVGPNA